MAHRRKRQKTHASNGFQALDPRETSHPSQLKRAKRNFVTTASVSHLKKSPRNSSGEQPVVSLLIAFSVGYVASKLFSRT